jgi:hypothetical protein
MLVFVHGWSVREPDYGQLPSLLEQQSILHICLSQYVSYSDSLTLDDLADAFERARQHAFPHTAFQAITHSTGGPILRHWMLRHANSARCLTALIMLAPPHHGSALAQLGKSRIARLKFWLEGVEPGQRILDWLELGSDQSWDLNRRWLDYQGSTHMLVLTGATPDRTLYDHINSYTGERGSDGVVRVAAANLNYTWMRLEQLGSRFILQEKRRSPRVSFCVLPGASHQSIQDVAPITPDAATPRTSMLTIKVRDELGPVDDFDFLLTAGARYDPDALPRGFFLDRQRNQIAPNTITYFFDYEALSQVQHLGFRIAARPATGPMHYRPAEYRDTLFLRPHETTLLEIVLKRVLEADVFRLLTE